MAHSDLKKRRRDDEERPRKKKKTAVRKQQHYSSPSDSEASAANDEFDPVNLADSDVEESEEAESVGDIEEIDSDEPPSRSTKISQKKSKNAPTSESSSVSSSDSDSESSLPSNPNRTKISKRNDPAAFATSISAILSSKLTTGKRADPVLARSATAAQANSEIASAKLETQAKQKLREDKKAALEKGRVKDVLLGTDAPGAVTGVDVGEEGDRERVKEMQELEKKLRKTAQRGVVKLFNAVRQAQVRAEEAAKERGSRGRREERVGEMSKTGFLELVAGGGGGGGGGKKMAEEEIEEA